MPFAIVPKHTEKWNPFDIVKESYGKRGLTLWENWESFRKRFFRNHPDKRNWNEHDAKKKELIQELEKCAKILERIEQDRKAA